MIHKEANLSIKVSRFMQYQYPRVIFRFDIADLKLTKPQAVRMKALQGGRRGFPDLFIAKPMKGYHGMYIELKNGYSDVFKKNGDLRKSDHLENQNDTHIELKEAGYHVVWGLGFDDTINKIKEYLK